MENKSVSIIQAGKESVYKITPLGLVVQKQNESYEDWAIAMRQFRMVDEAIQFSRGDLVNRGEDKFSEQYSQEIDAADNPADKTLLNWSWVCRQVPVSRRREKLTFSHHEVVASLEAKAQEKFLAQAQAKKLTVSKLRQLVREHKAKGQKKQDEKKTTRKDERVTVWMYGAEHRAADLLKELLDQAKRGRIDRVRVEILVAENQQIGIYDVAGDLKDGQIVSEWGNK